MVNQSTGSGFTLRWFLQAGSGIALIMLLAVHLLVNHWVVPQGLLTYADVIHYYDLPGIIWMEATFLIAVTVHALLGIHAILLDLDVRPGMARMFARALTVVGVIAILYGLWLIAAIRSRSIS